MIRFIFVLLSFLAPVSAFSAGLKTADLVGKYQIVGNGGFFTVDLTLEHDGAVTHSQRTMDGAPIVFTGVYSFNEGAQLLTLVLRDPSGIVATEDYELAPVTASQLKQGAFVSMTAKSSQGGEPVKLGVALKKIN